MDINWGVIVTIIIACGGLFWGLAKMLLDKKDIITHGVKIDDLERRMAEVERKVETKKNKH